MNIKIMIGLCASSPIALTSAMAQVEHQPAANPAANSVEIREIIVTAQKRASKLQETPLAISAVSGKGLQDRQITSIEALVPSLPNVNFGQNLGIARIAVRGLGLDATVAGQEARVAYHTDGVYISRPAAQLSTFFDINRVEVVRGPQGTLYGRNATAGAINVITNDPEDEFGGYGRLTVGNYGTFMEEGALTGPVSDTIGARIAFVKTDRQGFGKNLTTGEDIDDEHSFGARAKVKFEPSPVFSLTLAADYYTRNDAAFVYHYLGQGATPGLTPFGPALGGRLATNRRDTYANVAQKNRRHFGGVSGTAVYDFGFAELTSITAYRDGQYRLLSDADDTDAQVSQIYTTETSRQFSEEARLAGSTGRLDWLVGGFYFVERMSGETRFSPTRSPIPALRGAPVFGINADGRMKTDAYAAFGQIDYELIDGLTLTAGLRYSHEKKDMDQRLAVEFARPINPSQQPNYTQFQDDSVTFHTMTPKLGIQYKPSRNLMLYASYSKGFKSGGFNLAGIAPPVRPEKLTDYEGGIKSTLLDGRLTLNFAAFYYDYKDLQVQVIRGAAAVLENAASARLKGIESEITIRPVDGLELSGNAAYIDSKFINYSTIDSTRSSLGLLDLTGNRLPQAPEWTANAAAQYGFGVGDAKLTLRGEVQYSARVYFTPFNRPEMSQSAYAKGNLSVRYERPGGFSVSAFVRNVTNKFTIATANNSGSFSGFPVMGAYDAPRTFGATIGYSF